MKSGLTQASCYDRVSILCAPTLGSNSFGVALAFRSELRAETSLSRRQLCTPGAALARHLSFGFAC